LILEVEKEIALYNTGEEEKEIELWLMRLKRKRKI